MVTLDEYLQDAMRQEWKWGKMDCCAFAGGWIKAATARDPFGDFRGSYATAGRAKRILRGKSLVEIVSQTMEKHGFEETKAPEHGDIGILLLGEPGEGLRVAGASVAIRYSTWWIGRSVHGIAGTREDAVAAWRVLP